MLCACSFVTRASSVIELISAAVFLSENSLRGDVLVFIFFRRRAGFGLSGGGLFPRCTKLLVAITSDSLAYVIESCLLILALELCLLLFVIELCLHVPVRNVSPPCCDSVTTAAFKITNDDVCASVRAERDDVCAPVRVERDPSSGSNSPASWQIAVSSG